MGAAGERSEFDIKLLIGASLRSFPQGYLLKSFQQGDTSAIQRGLEISSTSPRQAGKRY